MAAARFGLGTGPNFEGGWHLARRQPLEATAEILRTPFADCARRWEAARVKLLAARAGRVRPGTDDKVLAGWNGLMIRGLAGGGGFWGSREGRRRQGGLWILRGGKCGRRRGIWRGFGAEDGLGGEGFWMITRLCWRGLWRFWRGVFGGGFEVCAGVGGGDFAGFCGGGRGVLSDAGGLGGEGGVGGEGGDGQG